MEKPKFELVGYVCPLGRYSSPATPIVVNPHYNDDNDKYLAVYLNDKLKMSTVVIHVTSEFVKLSSAQKKNFELENFDCREQRLFAVSKNDLRSYQPQKKKLFFGGLLSDANFSREDTFFRISLAEKIEDQNLIREELETGEQYLQKHDPDLLPFLEQEKSRLREIIKPLRESKPLPKNRELVHKKLGTSTGQGELIFS